MGNRKWCLAVLMMLALIVAMQEFSFVSAQSRVLYGAVYSASTGQPLAATVTASSCGYTQSTSTGPDGSWQITFPYGIFGRITFSAGGYVNQTFQIGSNAQWFDAGGIVSLSPAT
jgi:hypothetical protein